MSLTWGQGKWCIKFSVQCVSQYGYLPGYEPFRYFWKGKSFPFRWSFSERKALSFPNFWVGKSGKTFLSDFPGKKGHLQLNCINYSICQAKNQLSLHFHMLFSFLYGFVHFKVGFQEFFEKNGFISFKDIKICKNYVTKSPIFDNWKGKNFWMILERNLLSFPGF